jgi:hypothetical protein
MADGTNALNDWFLEEARKYLQDQVRQGLLTPAEANQLYTNAYNELYPDIPDTPEEMEAYYRARTGRSIPLKPGADKKSAVPDYDAVIAEMANDKAIQPKQIFDTSLYYDYDRWRGSNVNDDREYQAAAVAGGETLADYLARQVRKGIITRAEAEQKLTKIAYDTNIAEGKQLNEAYYKELKLMQESRKAESLQSAANPDNDEEIAKFQKAGETKLAELEEELLPYPSSEEASAAYSESLGDVINPAMKEYAKSVESEKWDKFIAGGGNKAIENWWKELNAVKLNEIERTKNMYNMFLEEASAPNRAYGGGGGSPLATILGITPGTAWGSLTATQQAGLQSGAQAIPAWQIAGNMRYNEYLRNIYEPAAEEARKKEAKAKTYDPWKDYANSQDWYTEFWSAPRSRRPGGTTQRTLAPSIRSY